MTNERKNWSALPFFLSISQFLDEWVPQRAEKSGKKIKDGTVKADMRDNETLEFTAAG